MEYFYDHIRIEEMLFDGVRQPSMAHWPRDLSRPGLGVGPKEQDAERYREM